MGLGHGDGIVQLFKLLTSGVTSPAQRTKLTANVQSLHRNIQEMQDVEWTNLLQRLKLHQLLHAAGNEERFGPSVLTATDRSVAPYPPKPAARRASAPPPFLPYAYTNLASHAQRRRTACRNEANNGRRRVLANDRSNKIDRSRDAAKRFAELSWVRHLAANGFWPGAGGRMEQPGLGMQGLFNDQQVRHTRLTSDGVRRRLGG